jgi:hypothetical protein
MIEYPSIFTTTSEETRVLAVGIAWNATDSRGCVRGVGFNVCPPRARGSYFRARGGRRPPSATAEPAALLLGPLRDSGAIAISILRHHCSPNAGTSSIVERHRSGPGICGVECAEDGGRRQDSGDYSAMTAHCLADSQFLPIYESDFTGIESLLGLVRMMSVRMTHCDLLITEVFDDRAWSWLCGVEWGSLKILRGS